MKPRLLLLFGVSVAALVAMGGAPVWLSVAVAGLPTEESDADGDGLSDFHEVHKYRTDPKKKDTAGQGVPDDDPKQRREFTYSVRAVIRVMPPYNLGALSDDYQDVRVLAETKEYAELEVTLYPLNTNAEAIAANPGWKKEYSDMREFLAPSVTTNWDEAMRGALLVELAEAGIDPDKLSDKEMVEQVSRWFYSRSKPRTMFCTNFVHFVDGKPVVYPGLEKAFQRGKGDPKWSDAEQFAHELFGKEMFYRKTYGTCTSAAVAQATVLRAVGIPTRIIGTIPLVDASDSEQVRLAEKGLRHHQVRHTVLAGLTATGESFANHSYLEVFVGRRWRRLNYTKLGQNTLDPNYLGLMVHVHTFNDLADAGLAPTWGARFALGNRDGVFRHSNPYRTVSLGDHFGTHAKVPNPPAKEHKRLTIGKVYWSDAKDAPATVRTVGTNAKAGSGRLFVHAEEWFDNAGEHLQYKPFLQKADGEFVLRAEGRPEVRCRTSGSFVTHGAEKLRDFEVVIPPDEFAKMASGVSYTLQPANPEKEYRWEVRGGLRVSRLPTAEEKMDAILERLDRLEKRLQELEKRPTMGPS